VNALLAFARAVDWLNETIGRAVSWLVLGLLFAQLLIVLLRHVYGQGSVTLQESVPYMQGTLFLAGAAYTLMHNGHVRVDVIHRVAGKRLKAAIDLLGSLFLLLPGAVLVGYVSFPYVHRAWSTLEGSAAAGGIEAVFFLKSVILVFVLAMFLQGLSMAIHALAVLTGREAPVEEEIEAEL
jgi:TRAP-type mannitol/chloroaromatic compound transport system permease small subunit